jgi:ankyrin repeat protein
MSGDINFQNKDGETSLHLAVEYADSDAVINLIKKGANVNIQNKARLTPLHLAVWNKDTEMVHFLLAARPDLNIQDAEGSTCLHITTYLNDINTVRALISAGAKLNIQDMKGYTALHQAVLKGNTEIIDALIKAGADLNILDYKGESPLEKAAKANNVEALKLLLDAMHDTLIPLDDSIDINEKEVHLIVGPDIYSGPEIKKAYDATQHSLTIHGDGINQVDLGKLNIPRNSRIIINAHGESAGAHHQIKLHSSLRFKSGMEYTGYSFQQIAAATNYLPMDLELHSCYGGDGITDIVYLPKGSTLMTFIDSYPAIAQLDIELMTNSANLANSENPLSRFAFYITSNPNDNQIAISGINKNYFFSSKIDDLNDYTENGIRIWHKQKINEFSDFLKSIHNGVSAVHKKQIKNYLSIFENEQNITGFLDTIDIKRFQEVLLFSLVSHVKAFSVKKLLSSNQININAVMQSGATSLSLAAIMNGVDMVRPLIEMGADVNIQNKDGFTAISAAVKANNHQAIQAFIEAGANLNVQDKNGATPIHLAIEANNHQVIQAFIEAGANLNIQDENGATPIHLAIIQSKNPNVVTKMLIDTKANLNLQDKNGYTPLHYATAIENSEIIKNLIKNGANQSLLNNDGVPCLNYAIIQGQNHLVQNFIEAGADLNVLDINGNTPLVTAILSNNREALKKLINAGANPNVSTYGKTPIDIKPEYFNDKAILKLFKEAIDEGDTKIVGNLLKYHSHLKDKTIDNSQETLLSYASTKNNPEMIAYMIDQGFKDQCVALEQPTLLNTVSQTLEKANEFLKAHDPLRIPSGVEATEIPRIGSTVRLPSPQSGIISAAPPVTQVLPEFSTQMALGAVLYKIGSDVYNLAQGYLNKTSFPIATSIELEKLNLKLHKRLIKLSNIPKLSNKIRKMSDVLSSSEDKIIAQNFIKEFTELEKKSKSLSEAYYSLKTPAREQELQSLYKQTKQLDKELMGYVNEAAEKFPQLTKHKAVNKLPQVSQNQVQAIRMMTADIQLQNSLTATSPLGRLPNARQIKLR